MDKIGMDLSMTPNVGSISAILLAVVAALVFCLFDSAVVLARPRATLPETAQLSRMRNTHRIVPYPYYTLSHE